MQSIAIYRNYLLWWKLLRILIIVISPDFEAILRKTGSLHAEKD